MRFILVILLISSGALASEVVDKEKVIIGKWEVSSSHRADRIVFFHSNHTWGVTNFDPNGPEEINGRRWRIENDRLVLTYPGDNGFETRAYKIVLFNRDKFAANVFTYKRIK